MGSRNSNVTNVKRQSKTLSMQKRNEVTELVKNLLQVSSEESVNPKVDWENHLKIDDLLQKIMQIEPGITQQNREVHFNNMMKWIKRNGGVTECVTINKFENMEYGLQATENLSEGQIICSVPMTLMMTVENVKQSSLKQLYNSDPILKNMDNVALALFLVLEYLKGTNSFWHPYIAALPGYHNTILYFTLDELKELECSPTFEPALKHCKNIARQYAYFYQVFQKSDDDASSKLRHNFTYQLYRWAVSTVMTRQSHISSKDEQFNMIALIPLWDMCNHTNGHLSSHVKGFYLKRCECLAFRPFKKGEQVLIFYGIRSNSDFLIHNGFVYEENQHDNYRLKLGISKADPLYEIRLNLLSRLGIPPCAEFRIYGGSEPLDATILAFLRVFNMDEGGLKHWIASERVEDLGCVDCALDTEIECKVWKFLFQRLELLLMGYSKLPKDDEVGITQNRRNARLLCKLETNLLQSALDYVRQRLKI